MSKILFIGNITDGSGYSNASKRLVTAMDVVGLDVAYRNMRLSGNFVPLSPRFQELSTSPTEDCKVIITNLLPNLYDYDGRFRNIGIFSSETSKIPYLWERSLRVMDEIWVPNRYMKSILKHIKKPVEVVPFPVDTYKEMPINTGYIHRLKANNEHFVFLHVGEFNARKNYEMLLTSYLTTFSLFDNVALVLKTHIDGLNEQETAQKVNELINHVKKQLKLRYYPNIEVLAGQYDAEFINSLHFESDCFVSASHGESCCLPALDSLCFGVPVIVPNCTGFKDYVLGDCGIKVSTDEIPCYGTDNQWYDATQNWWLPSIRELKSAMYNMRYNVNGVYNRSKRFCESYKQKLIQNRGYTAVGNQIKSLLNL